MQDHLFAFPLNLILAAVWFAFLGLLYRRERQNVFVRFWLSQKMTVCTLVMTIVGALGVAFIPGFTTCWVFPAMLLFVQTHLFLITLRGFRRNGHIRWRFLLNHAGLWLALAGGFWGSPDTVTLRMPVFRDRPSDEAFHEDGRITRLGVEARLLDFRVEHYDNGVPAHYEARLMLGTDTAVLRVNHPVSLSLSEEVYLIGYDTAKGSDTGYCILQVVREPWRGVTHLGILLMMAGAVLLFINGPKTKRI